MTKTTTFIKEVYPGAPIPRYYVTRKMRTPLPHTRPRSQPRSQPQFMLNIPLVPSHELIQSAQPEPEVCTQSTPPEPEVCTQSTPPEPEVCTQSTPPEAEVCTQSTPPEAEVCTQSTPPEAEVCTQSTPPEAEVCTQSTPPEAEVCTQSTPPLFLTPELYEEVVKDLSKDPEIWNYLNGISMEDDMNDMVVEDMGDMFFNNISTPLEMELAAIDY